MINVKLVIQNILYRKGPLTRNQLFDILVREAGIRETRENFDAIVDDLLDRAKIIKVGGTVI